MRWLWFGICFGAQALWADDLVHFHPGDAVPLEVKVDGDLFNLVGSSNLWLVVRQECWMEPRAPLFSWDGVHWLEFEQFVGGEIHGVMGDSQATLSIEMSRK